MSVLIGLRRYDTYGLVISLKICRTLMTGILHSFFLYSTPNNSLVYTIVTSFLMGPTVFSCMPGLFGREYMVPEHESKIRILAPDPTVYANHNFVEMGSPQCSTSTFTYLPPLTTAASHLVLLIIHHNLKCCGQEN